MIDVIIHQFKSDDTHTLDILFQIDREFNINPHFPFIASPPVCCAILVKYQGTTTSQATQISQRLVLLPCSTPIPEAITDISFSIDYPKTLLSAF